MTNVWKRVRHYIVPTHENVYRPHVLGRGWMMFFLALTLAIEGFLVSSLVARQSDAVFLTEAPTQNTAALGAVGEAQSLTQSFGRQFVRTMGDPDVANSLLGVVGGLLLVVVVLTFFVHLDVQAHDALLGGFVVASLAFICIATNMHFISSSTPESAAGISALAP